MKNILIMGRGEGKTAALIQKSHITNIPILTHYPPYVTDLASRLGLTIPEPVRFSEYDLYKDKEVYIDDLDDFLYYIGVRANTCTLTMDQTKVVNT